jgi:hypothetical protein
MALGSFRWRSAKIEQLTSRYVASSPLRASQGRLNIVAVKQEMHRHGVIPQRLGGLSSRIVGISERIHLDQMSPCRTSAVGAPETAFLGNYSREVGITSLGRIMPRSRKSIAVPVGW